MSNKKIGGFVWPEAWSLRKVDGVYDLQKSGAGWADIGPPTNKSSIAETMLYYLLEDVHDATLDKRREDQ